MNKKVYILTILMFVMAINAVFSQTAKKLSYQAVVRNAANELVVNQNISVEITILNADNAPQYKETHTVTTNQNGLMWLWIGDGTPSQGTIDEVVWKDATIQSSFTLPDGNTVTQNTPVTAMPYAYYADEVDSQVIQDYLNGHHYITDDNDYVENPQLDDTLSHYYTNEVIDDTLGHYVTTDKLNDTLSHYIMHEVQVLSISHDTIFLTGGSYVVLPKGFSGSYHDLIDTPTNVSAFTNDANYVTTTQMNDQHYLTSDSAVITTMQTNITNLQNGIKKNALCDSVNDCVHGWISDSTRMVIDSLNRLLRYNPHEDGDPRHGECVARFDGRCRQQRNDHH